jgi:hypothetical protein
MPAKAGIQDSGHGNKGCIVSEIETPNIFIES